MNKLKCKICGNNRVRKGRKFCSRKCYGISLQGKPSQFKGKKHTDKIKKKMSIICKLQGRKPPSRKGIKHSEEWKKNMSRIMKGRKFSEKTIQKRIKSVRRGKDCHFWKGGITSIITKTRQSFNYRKWRAAVYKRDNYTCTICKQIGGQLNADHIKAFSLIFYENHIRTFDDAIKCKDLWNINNGRTLCLDCHKKTDNFANRAIIRYKAQK